MKFDVDEKRLPRALEELDHELRGAFELARNEAKVSGLMRQVRDYLAGKRTSFDVELELSWVTPFRRDVLLACAAVPRGQVATYADLARRVGSPNAARAVGNAMRTNPIPIVIPCHRIVGSNGSLTGFGGGLDVKARLLGLEGAAFALTGETAPPSLRLGPPRGKVGEGGVGLVRFRGRKAGGYAMLRPGVWRRIGRERKRRRAARAACTLPCWRAWAARASRAAPTTRRPGPCDPAATQARAVGARRDSTGTAPDAAIGLAQLWQGVRSAVRQYGQATKSWSTLRRQRGQVACSWISCSSASRLELPVVRVHQGVFRPQDQVQQQAGDVEEENENEGDRLCKRVACPRDDVAVRPDERGYPEHEQVGHNPDDDDPREILPRPVVPDRKQHYASLLARRP